MLATTTSRWKRPSLFLLEDNGTPANRVGRAGAGLQWPGRLRWQHHRWRWVPSHRHLRVRVAGRVVLLLTGSVWTASTELLEDVLAKRPLEVSGLDSVIVVNNIPKVGPDRIDRLKAVIKKVMTRFGAIKGEPVYPLDEQGHTKG